MSSSDRLQNFHAYSLFVNVPSAPISSSISDWDEWRSSFARGSTLILPDKDSPATAQGVLRKMLRAGVAAMIGGGDRVSTWEPILPALLFSTFCTGEIRGLRTRLNEFDRVKFVKAVVHHSFRESLRQVDLFKSSPLYQDESDDELEKRSIILDVLYSETFFYDRCCMVIPCLVFGL